MNHTKSKTVDFRYTKWIISSLLLMGLIFIFTTPAHARYKNKTYQPDKCYQDGYYCIKVKAGDTWNSLFDDPREREIVRRINRTNTGVHNFRYIAVPDDLSYLGYLDFSPFPQYRDTDGDKLIFIDLSDLAFGAYDENGDLVHWGPVSGGRGYCPDVRRACNTKKGTFKIYSRMPASHVSSIYPVETNGGAPMPYAMHYYRGFALHGSPTVPGYNASHGCVRLMVEDARWLNKEFVDIGTKIIVQN